MDAERIINDLWQQINSIIESYFGYLDTSKLRCLVENDIPYHKFLESLSIEDNKQLYNKFLKWIVTELSKQDCEIIERSMWYSQLIHLELNHIYKLWYGEEPPLILRDGLDEYLKKNKKKYYDRIKSFHLKSRLKYKS